MNNVQTISTVQMAILFQAYMTGSSILNIQDPLFAVAKQDAWISLFIGNAVGFLILFLVLFLYHRYPTLTLVHYSREIIGSTGTVVVMLPIVFLLFLILSSMVTGMGNFFTTAMMRETPPYLINMSILFVAALTVRSGIEVIARMFEALFYLIILIVALIFILSIPLYEPAAILPIAYDSWKPILHGAYITFGFPYMDIMYFSMILPFIRKDSRKAISKWLYIGLLFNGIVLITSIVLPFMSLGPLAVSEKFPIYQLSRLIDIGDVFQRMESIFGMALILGSYMKITLFLFVLNLIVTQLLRMENDRSFILLIAFIVSLFSVTMFEHEIELGESGSMMQPVASFFLAFLPLLILVLISLIRGKERTQSN